MQKLSIFAVVFCQVKNTHVQLVFLLFVCFPAFQQAGDRFQPTVVEVLQLVLVSNSRRFPFWCCIKFKIRRVYRGKRKWKQECLYSNNYGANKRLQVSKNRERTSPRMTTICPRWTMKNTSLTPFVVWMLPQNGIWRKKNQMLQLLRLVFNLSPISTEHRLASCEIQNT